MKTDTNEPRFSAHLRRVGGEHLGWYPRQWDTGRDAEQWASDQIVPHGLEIAVVGPDNAQPRETTTCSWAN